MSNRCDERHRKPDPGRQTVVKLKQVELPG
jgi:hypothetical protein